eukprot:TRINITY_DN70593_c0_g1_i1.p1 TRINITY_DN70593_c0_g1~~TRINITY_DN70593_c0_g1_i1.p1  ORF type:complete len:420 (+),score=118.31 TRINITY_DN70593_c0_g1_i1:81-1262(+)
MGNSVAAAAPASLQVVAAARSDLAGLYRRVTPATEVTLEKQPQESLGLRLSPPGNHLVAVRPGTPAQRAGCARFLGRQLTHIEGEAVGESGPSPGVAAGKTAVVLTFAAEPEAHSGLPVWAKAPQCRLYGTAEGKWMITDAGQDGMRRNAGHLMTGLHGGRLPHEGLQWHSFSKERGVWAVDEAVTVAEVSRPLFRVDQLVEAKMDYEGDEHFRDAHVREALPASALEEGQPGQYRVSFLGASGQTVQLPAACLRPHSAYRVQGTPSGLGPTSAPAPPPIPTANPAAPTADGAEPPLPSADELPIDCVVEAIVMRPLSDITTSYPIFKRNFEEVDEHRQAELREMWGRRDMGRLRPVLIDCYRQDNFKPLAHQDALTAADLAAGRPVSYPRKP